MAEVLIAAGYAVATLLSVAVLWRSLRARPRPGATWLAFVMAGVTWWSALSFGLALTADPLGPIGTLLGRLEWFGIAVIAVGMVRLGFALSGRDGYLLRRGVAALLSLPFAWSVVGLAHAEIIGLARGVSPPLASVLAALAPLAPLYVWLNPVIVGGVYLALAVGTFLLVETAFERPAVQPRRLLTFLMVLPPWTLNVLYLTGVTANAGYDPTVLGFVVTGVAGIAAVDRFRMFETPFARSEVVEELDTPVMVFGADGRLYDYNERAASVLGLDETFLDEPVEAVVDRTPLCVEASASSLAATPTDVLDDVGVTVDTDDGADLTNASGPGRRHYLLTTTELGRRGGRGLGYAVQLSDVTRQRRQQDQIREKSRRLERKNEQLERLAGIVAHDMQTPISTGQRLLDLLRLDLDRTDEEVAQSLADLERVLDRLDGFAEHLPRLARESINVEEPVECDLETVARSAWNVVETADLALVVEDTTTLKGDPRRLQQVFENLFRNAVEHGVRGDSGSAGGRAVAADPSASNVPSAPDDPSVADSPGPGIPSGGRDASGQRAGAGERGADDQRREGGERSRASVVRVGTLSGNPDAGTPTRRGFYVEDDGPGIPTDYRDNAFTFGDGTGYGLAIVRTIVEAHGWSVAVLDGADGGARFEIDCAGTDALDDDGGDHDAANTTA